MAVPPEPGLAGGAGGGLTLLVRGQPGIMGTGDKRSAAQNLEPDAAQIPLLEPRTPGAPRWNTPQGESLPHPGSGWQAGFGAHRKQERKLWVPSLSWGLNPGRLLSLTNLGTV